MAHLQTNTSRRPWILLFLGLATLSRPGSSAATPTQTEIQVNLLGQPCLLQGPLQENTLKRIHAIGPAQIYPIQSSTKVSHSIRETQLALNKVRNFQKLPLSFESYQKHLITRLEAQLALFDALEAFQKSHQTQFLWKTAKNYLKPKDLKGFEAILKKLTTAPANPSSNLSRAALDELVEFYNDGIEPDPEPEFHRALKKLRVKYVCSFEEELESNDPS